MGNWPVAHTPEANDKYLYKVTILTATRINATLFDQLQYCKTMKT
jgi:hypothetical protein